MLKCYFDVSTANAAFKNGIAPGVIEKLMGLTKPEAAYFTADGGTRTLYIFFDLKDPSDMPPIGELIWNNFGGKVEIQPVMNQDELQKGLSKLV